MAQASSILTDARGYLHDADGVIWTDAELLDYLNDGHLRLVGEPAVVRELAALDTPPRVAMAVTQAWEAQHAAAPSATWAFDTRTADAYRVAYAWEIEHLLGATPTASAHTYTQPWERIVSGSAPRTDRYAYPADHLKTVRVCHDDQRLWPTAVRDLDAQSTTWETESGDPLWYQRGLGQQGQFELWEQVSAYAQTYAAVGCAGTVRGWSGSRTWQCAAVAYAWDYAYTTPGDAGHSGVVLAGIGLQVTDDTSATADYQACFDWEAQQVEGATVTAGSTTYLPTNAWEYEYTGDAATAIAGLGTPRTFAGTRQYVCRGAQSGAPATGVPRTACGSEDNILLDYAVRPLPLTTTDTPGLLPSRFDKYLRYYVLARAFGRDGEGQQPQLADHFEQRFRMGQALLRRLASAASGARTYQHAPLQATTARPRKPRLPSTYPRVA